jgi:hypothetical protein
MDIPVYSFPFSFCLGQKKFQQERRFSGVNTVRRRSQNPITLSLTYQCILGRGRSVVPNAQKLLQGKQAFDVIY